MSRPALSAVHILYLDILDMVVLRELNWDSSELLRPPVLLLTHFHSRAFVAILKLGQSGNNHWFGCNTYLEIIFGTVW